MIILTKNEINLLIKNYLHRNDYYHSHFAFSNEVITSESETIINLEEIIMKGMQYLYVEKHIINERYVPCDNKFQIDKVHKCVGKESDLFDQNLSKENGIKNKIKEIDTDFIMKSKDDKEVKENENFKIKNGKNREKKEKGKNRESDYGRFNDKNDRFYDTEENSGESKKSLKLTTSILKDHIGDVSLCAWDNDILATGSDDHTVRIFKDGKQILEKKVNAEVTALEWHDNALSVGNYIGEVYTIKENTSTVSKNHIGPVFALKHNQTLLSVGYDGKAFINNKSIKIHNKAILDCDFLNPNSFITCSSDFTIGLVNLQTQDIEYLTGHVNEVNCISQRDNIIASSSDDCSVILWNIISRKNITLNNHTKNVYQHKFYDKKLVSIGNDGRVNSWDVMKGILDFSYEHEKGVYGVDVNPLYNLIITGGGDRNVIFYDHRVGEVKRYATKGSVYDIKVSGGGNYCCVCVADGVPYVMDMRYG